MNWIDPYGEWGSQVADWIQARIECARQFYTCGSTSTAWIGTVDTVCELLSDAGDPLRLGESAGTASAGGQDWVSASAEEAARLAKLLPAGKICKSPVKRRTPAENKQARTKFKNNKDEARKAYEERTGQKWPTDEHGNPWPAEHTPPLKEGGDPMTVTPRDPGVPDPHNIPGPDGLTDYQRWGAEGPPARDAK
jgi:hypothetical protein